MKGPVRIFVVAALLVLQQAITPLLGSARMDLVDRGSVQAQDPCEDLDPSPDPSPTPTPSPSPSPSADPDEEEGEEEACDEQDGGGEDGGEDGGGEDGGEDGGGEDQGGEDGGGEDQGGEDQGGEDQGGEDQGGEDQGGEDQGGDPTDGSDADDPEPSPSPAPSPDDSGKGGDAGEGGKGGGSGDGSDDGGSDRDGAKQGGGTPGGGNQGGDPSDDGDGEQLGALQEEVDTESPGFFLGGPQNTSSLIKVLSELTQYGVPLRKSLAEVVGPFPVAGLAWWTDDWHACRDGCSRLHKGLDIFAREGTPLVAAADGVVTQKGTGDLAGLYVEITDGDGVEYFYGHLSGFPEGMETGDEVEIGEVVGYVGNTGNAITTPPHVHFEYQPEGVPAPPKPLVDRWLRIAERRALELVREYEGEEPIALEDLDTFRLARLFDLGGQGPAGQGPGSELLILAGLQPAASSLEMARRTLDRMAWEIDWSGQIDAELAALIEEYERSATEEQLLEGPLSATRPEAPEDQLEESLAELGD